MRVLIPCALLLSIGCGSAQPPAVVRAQRFVLIDSAGRETAELTTENGGPRLSLRDNLGKDRIVVYVDAADRAWVKLLDDDGGARFELGVSDAGGGRIIVDAVHASDATVGGQHLGPELPQQ
jgi:hypothetical protein